MYEDTWYSYTPEQHKRDEVSPDISRHRRKESLLKQPNVSQASKQASNQKLNYCQGKHDLQGPSDSVLDILEDGIRKTGPPIATLVKRAKSYSDFYEVCNSYFGKGAKIGPPADVLEPTEDFEIESLFASNYEQYENELLDVSQEDYQYVQGAFSIRKNTLNEGSGCTKIS